MLGFMYFLQEEYINAICEKVFQKFPEFLKRCKDTAFEAMSDPMYSGKMRVGLIHKQKYIQTNQGFLITNISSFQDLKDSSVYLKVLCHLFQVLQKLLRHFLQKKDKVLLFSLSTKVGF